MIDFEDAIARLLAVSQNHRTSRGGIVNISADRGFEGKPSPRITVVHDPRKRYSTSAADALTKPRLRCWINIYCTAAANHGNDCGDRVVGGASKRAVVLASSEW